MVSEYNLQNEFLPYTRVRVVDRATVDSSETTYPPLLFIWAAPPASFAGRRAEEARITFPYDILLSYGDGSFG